MDLGIRRMEWLELDRRAAGERTGLEVFPDAFFEHRQIAEVLRAHHVLSFIGGELGPRVSRPPSAAVRPRMTGIGLALASALPPSVI